MSAGYCTAMTEERVERVRHGYDVFNSRGVNGMVEEFWATNIVMDSTTADLPGAGVYRGLNEVREFFATLFSVWESWEIEPTKILEAGDRILVFATIHGRGATSGATVDMEWAQLLTLEDERVVRIENYTDRDKALQAAGLAD
jgi:ketosteroid isomerase-like protein